MVGHPKVPCSVATLPAAPRALGVSVYCTLNSFQKVMQLHGLGSRQIFPMILFTSSVLAPFSELLSSVERTPVNVTVSLNEYKKIASSKSVVKWWPVPQGSEGLQDHWKHIVPPPTYFLQVNVLHAMLLSDSASKIWLVLQVTSLRSSGCQKPIS